MTTFSFLFLLLHCLCLLRVSFCFLFLFLFVSLFVLFFLFIVSSFLSNPPHLLPVPLSDVEISVVGCNLGACTSLPPPLPLLSSPSLVIPVCEGGEEVVGEGLREAERLLEEERLEEALQIMLAISEVDNCTQMRFVGVILFFWSILFSFSFI